MIAAPYGIQLDLKDKLVVVMPCGTSAACIGQRPGCSSQQMVRWFQNCGAKGVVLPFAVAAIPPATPVARAGMEHANRNRGPSVLNRGCGSWLSSHFDSGRNNRDVEQGLGRTPGRCLSEDHSDASTIPGVFMQAAHILEAASILQHSTRQNEGHLVPGSLLQRAEESLHLRSFLLSDPRFADATHFGPLSTQRTGTSGRTTPAQTYTLESSSATAAATAAAESTTTLPTSRGAICSSTEDTSSYAAFVAASAAQDRMDALEARIASASTGVLPEQLVLEFLWLKHRAEQSPRLDTLGPKGHGHGGVASMPRSLYTATVIIPLIVTALVNSSDAALDIEAGIVSRRGVLESLFCLGDVKLPRGPQRSWATSAFACCAVCGVRCFDAMYAWFVSGAPWYLFHFSNLLAQAIFIWYIRSADDVEQQQQYENGTAPYNGTGTVGGGLFAGSVGEVEFVPTCEASSPLRFVAAGVYSGMLFKEVCETCNMAAWLYRAPCSAVTERIQVSRASPATESIDMVSGFSRLYKIWCVGVAIIPKFVLAGALWYYGGAFILRAVNNSELILNTVAVTFINEIDDLLYSVLVPADIDSLLADLPEFEWMPAVPTTKQTKLQRWSVALSVFTGQYLYAGIIIAMTFSSLAFACA